MFIVIVLESIYNEEIVEGKKKFDTWKETRLYLEELIEDEYLPMTHDTVEDTIKYIVDNGEMKGRDEERSVILIDMTRL